MMDRDLQFLLNAPAVNTDGGWVQVAKVGSFQDPRYGRFKITDADLQKWIANFNSLAAPATGREGLPIDVDHSPEKKGDTEAVGWVKQLEKRGDELWAKPEWNTLGSELIKDKRYAYISPSYTKDYKDESGSSHGTAMVGIALTNRPFLKMATVNLSAFTFAETEPDEGDRMAPDDEQALGEHVLDISEPARQKHAVIVKKVDGKTKHMFPIPPGDKLHARLALSFLPRAIKAGHVTESEASAVRSRAQGVLGGDTKTHSAYSHRQMDANAILEALGLDRKTLNLAEDATDEVILAAIKQHQATPPEPTPPTAPEGSVNLSQEQVTQLLADAAAGRAAAKELHDTKFENAFTDAQRSGKVVPAQKETMLSLFEQDADATLKLLSELPATINMTPAGMGGEPADLSAEAAQLATDFQDRGKPADAQYALDTDMLKIHTRAVQLEREKNVSYEQALVLAEGELS